MTPFSFESPPAVHFGSGSLRRLGPAASSHGRRIFLLTGGGSFDGSPRMGAALAELSACEVQRWRCPSSEPSEQSVDDAAAAALAFGPDVLVGIGGGSVIDTAKAVSVLLRSPGPCGRFLEGTAGFQPVAGPGVPWIAVPTTAGTGAEVTKNAVIRSDAAGAKRSMRSPFLLADTVIVDPDLTVSLPAAITGASGLDALTQLIEAYVSRGTNRLVGSIVEGAFPLMMDALEKLPDDPGNIDLRTKASYGALVSGLALANAGLGAAHGFAAAVGAYHVPHGLACAIFLPLVLEANAAVAADRLRRLAALVPGASHAGDAVGWLSEKVTGFLAGFGLPRTLAGFRIPRSKLADLAEKSMGSSMRGNPRELDLEERTSILARVI